MIVLISGKIETTRMTDIKTASLVMEQIARKVTYCKSLMRD